MGRFCGLHHQEPGQPLGQGSRTEHTIVYKTQGSITEQEKQKWCSVSGIGGLKCDLVRRIISRKGFRKMLRGKLANVGGSLESGLQSTSF